MNRYFSTGDLGDVIASLPAVRALGGGEYIIGFHEWTGQRESMRGPRFEAIKPLLESQPYIHSVQWSDHPRNITHDFSSFRSAYSLHGNLAEQQARHVGAQIKLHPWLQVETKVNNKIVMARSLRYRNGLFPWRKLVERYKNKIFVGLPIEHREFENCFGEIEFVPTSDLLELAKIIADCKCLISNQTAAWWIGAGLGVPVVQETYLKDMNSIIERPNLTYSRTISEINELLK